MAKAGAKRMNQRNMNDECESENNSHMKQLEMKKKDTYP